MRHGLLLSTVIALAMLLVPEVALAQGGGGDDEVSLKNGGMIRGTIVSLEPDKEVVILVGGTGQQRRIAWAEVDKVKRGKNTATTSSKAADDDEAPAHKGKHGKKAAASSDDDDEDEGTARKGKHDKKGDDDDD